MTKLNKILLILLVCQVAILAIIGFTSTRNSTQSKQQKIFVDLKVDDITKFAIVDSNKNEVVLTKVDKDWVLQSGGDYPALNNKANDFLAKLPPLTIEQQITDKAEYSYALEVSKDKFQRKLTLTKKDGKTESFYLGSSPGLKNVHLRREQSKEVFLVKGLSSWDAGVSSSDWVDSEYFKVERDEMRKITLQNAKGELVLNKGTDGKWQVEGLNAKLKETEVDAFVGSVSLITLKEIVGKQLNSELGFDKPSATLTIVTEKSLGLSSAKDDNKDPKEPISPPKIKVSKHGLTIGAKTGDDYYAKSFRSEFVVKLAAWTVDSFLEKKTSDFEEKEKDKDKDKDSN